MVAVAVVGVVVEVVVVVGGDVFAVVVVVGDVFAAVVVVGDVFAVVLVDVDFLVESAVVLLAQLQLFPPPLPLFQPLLFFL